MTCTVQLTLASLPSFMFYLDWGSEFDLRVCPNDCSIRIHHVRAHSFDYVLVFQSRIHFDKALAELTRNLQHASVYLV